MCVCVCVYVFFCVNYVCLFRGQNVRDFFAMKPVFCVFVCIYMCVSVFVHELVFFIDKLHMHPNTFLVLYPTLGLW